MLLILLEPWLWVMVGILVSRNSESIAHNTIRSWLKALFIRGLWRMKVAKALPKMPKITNTEDATPYTQNFHSFNSWKWPFKMMTSNQTNVVENTSLRCILIWGRVHYNRENPDCHCVLECKWFYYGLSDVNISQVSTENSGIWSVAKLKHSNISNFILQPPFLSPKDKRPVRRTKCRSQQKTAVPQSRKEEEKGPKANNNDNFCHIRPLF